MAEVQGIVVDQKDLELFSAKKSNSIFVFDEYVDKDVKIRKRQPYSEEGIIKLIENDKYFRQVIDTLEFSTRRKINIVGVNDVKQAINRVPFVNICVDLYERNKLSNIKNVEQKISLLKHSVSFDKIVKNSPAFEVVVGGDQRIVYPTTEMVDAFYSLVNQHKKQDLVPSKRNKVFVYSIRKFLEKNDVLNNVLLTNSEQNCVCKILNDDWIDTMSLEEINSTVDTLGEIKLHPDLEKYIFNKMPKDYSKIEKAIYAYIKLCRMSTYDAEFYAEGQSEEVNNKHTDAAHLSEICPKNNEVVCYEINKIYAQLLRDMGIKYEVMAELGEYGHGHSNLTFKANDFLVKADTVSSILGSDILNTKTHSPITGLKCQNANKDMQARFDRVVKKVYDDIKTREPSPYVEGDTIDKWGELLTIFIEDPVDVTMKEKIDLFTDVAKTNKLPLTERIAYLTKVYNKMFSKDKMTYMTIVSQKKEENKFKKPTLVITYNDVHKITNIVHNKYVLLDDGEWKHIPRATLQDMFNNGKLSYISDHVIPGINRPEREDKNDQPT